MKTRRENRKQFFKFLKKQAIAYSEGYTSSIRKMEICEVDEPKFVGFIPKVYFRNDIAISKKGIDLKPYLDKLLRFNFGYVKDKKTILNGLDFTKEYLVEKGTSEAYALLKKDLSYIKKYTPIFYFKSLDEAEFNQLPVDIQPYFEKKVVTTKTRSGIIQITRYYVKIHRYEVVVRPKKFYLTTALFPIPENQSNNTYFNKKLYKSNHTGKFLKLLGYNSHYDYWCDYQPEALYYSNRGRVGYKHGAYARARYKRANYKIIKDNLETTTIITSF